MKLTHIIFLLLFFISCNAIASGYEFANYSHSSIYIPPPKKQNQQDRLIIKPFTPSGLLEIHRTFYLAAEIPVTKQWGIQPEIGYIYNSVIAGTSFNENKLSYDLRLSQRYYLPQSTLLGFYMGPEVFFKNVNYNAGQYYCLAWAPDSTSQSGYKCTDLQRNIYELNRKEYGLLLRIGFQPILFKRLALDFSIGLGLKYIKSTTDGKKENTPYPGQSEPVTTIQEKFEKSGFSHSIPPGVKIGFVF